MDLFANANNAQKFLFIDGIAIKKILFLDITGSFLDITVQNTIT